MNQHLTGTTLAELQHNLNALEFSRSIRETSRYSYNIQKAKLEAEIEKLTTKTKALQK